MPTTRPGEYLVVAQKGALINRGEAATVLLKPGTPWVAVPAVQHSTSFEMTQETCDGIPLRFKGNLVYRIIRPEVTATLFDFSRRDALDHIDELLAQTCLAELRDTVSRLSLAECIETRKTTLTEAVRQAVTALVSQPRTDWGLAIEVVQVAQVFIVDTDLRAQLEARTRNEIFAQAASAELKASESGKLAEIASQRRIEDEALANETQKAMLERRKAQESYETQRIQLQLERELRTLRIEGLRSELEERRLEVEVRTLLVQRDMLQQRAEHELKLELLPVEQRPQVVEAAAKLFQGTKLSVYGEDSKLLAGLEPVLEAFGAALRG